MIIWNKQFEYPNSQRSIKGEYDITNMLLPSVTTVLNATQPESKRKSLDRWIAAKGEDEATRIKELAGRRGTAHQRDWLAPGRGGGPGHLVPGCRWGWTTYIVGNETRN